MFANSPTLGTFSAYGQRKTRDLKADIQSVLSDILRLGKRRHSGKESKASLIRRYDKSRKNQKLRVELFFRIWLHNLTSRNVTMASAALVVPAATIYLIGDVLMHDSTTRKHREESPVVPRPLEILGVTSEVVDFFYTLLHTKYRGKTVAKLVLFNAGSALIAGTVVQVSLSLLQTVLEVLKHDRAGRQRREMLVELALALNVEGAEKMNMDQLRVAIAQTAVDAKKQAEN